MLEVVRTIGASIEALVTRMLREMIFPEVAPLRINEERTIFTSDPVTLELVALGLTLRTVIPTAEQLMEAHVEDARSIERRTNMIPPIPGRTLGLVIDAGDGISELTTQDEGLSKTLNIVTS